MEVRQQKCFAHGLDLVVRKVVYGKEASAFDIEILREDTSENAEGATDDEDIDGETENEAEPAVLLGEALERLRCVMRDFKKKPIMMDDVRRTTAKSEYNEKELKPIPDCRTRWYSTLLMVERALAVMPRVNNVLSRHGTPISAQDVKAFKKIVAVVMLCKDEATLSHADKVFELLIQGLRKSESELANKLLENLLGEIAKRRSILTTALGVLNDANYDFAMELQVTSKKPSNKEILIVLEEILGVGDDGVATDSELSETFAAAAAEPAPKLSWENLFTPSTSSKTTGRCRSSEMKQNLRRELALFKVGGVRGPLLNICHEVLEGVPPTSVQAERDFSTARLILGEHRARLSSESFDDIFVIQKAFGCDAI